MVRFEVASPISLTPGNTYVIEWLKPGDGTLAGSGAGKSAEGRMNALRNMLEVADGLIDDGDYEGACEQLIDAYVKIDSQWPLDFVSGEAAPTLAGMILEVIGSLGCD